MAPSSTGDEEPWQRKLQYYTAKGFHESYNLWHEYDLAQGSYRTPDARGSRISLESFDICMRFVEGLTSAENLERAMRVIRAARIESRRCVAPTGDEVDHSLGEIKPQPVWFAGFLEAYRLEHRAHGIYTHRNLLMSRMSEEPGPSQGLLDREHQRSLKRLMPQEFARWSPGQWDSLARNACRWQILTQHPDWRGGGGSLYGLALLLPMS